MRTPARSLLHVHVHQGAAEMQAAAASAPAPPSHQDASPPADSDMVVILASFLCALVCVLGLALVSRCAWRRFAWAFSSNDPTQQPTSPPPPPPRGLKKKAIDALPTASFTAGASPSSECAICLADFAEGEALRVLPRCGHGFHVACVDAWLRTRATCPTCRARAAIIVAAAAPQQANLLAPAGVCCGQPSAAAAGDDDAFLP